MSDGIPYNTPNIYVVTQIPDGLEYAQSKEISVEYPSLKVVEEKYFIKSSESIEINTIGKCGTEELPAECIEENVTTIEPNTWYQVSGNVSFTVNKNLTIEAIIGNKNEYGSKKIYEVNNIDTTEPSISIKNISTTSNKIIVSAECEDLESNIIKQEYTIDGTSYQENNVFNNLSSTSTYKVKVRCTNGSGISKEIESEEISLSEIIKPTIEQVSQTPSSGEWAQKRIIRITYNNENIENPKYYYSLDNETWIEVSETTKDIEFTSNGYLYAKTEDETGNTANASAFTVTNIDTSVPSAPTIKTNDNKASGTWHSANTTLTFSGSSSVSGITYYYGTSTSAMTKQGSSVTISSNTSGTTYYVKACNGAGLCSGNSSYTVKLDISNPTVSASVSGKVATLTLKDNLSLAGYTVTTTTTTPTSWTAISGTSVSKSWTASKAGTYYAWVKDTSGRTAYKAFTIASSAFCSYTAGQAWNFAYTGGIQTFKTPCAGTYKLEVWGAQGGKSYCNTSESTGGLGGYSYGNKTLTLGTNLYVTVGGQGLDKSSAGTTKYGDSYPVYLIPGGYNGGGSALIEPQHAAFAGSGGGATHIATATGVLSNLSSNKSAVLIVAGGGGGGSASRYNALITASGGNGGGTTGESGANNYASTCSNCGNGLIALGGAGGTQTSGNAFGKGGNVPENSWNWFTISLSPPGGGGGGWYGGYSDAGVQHTLNGAYTDVGSHGGGGGGGGSGYIGGVTGGSMQSGVRSGNGYARITLVSTN